MQTIIFDCSINECVKIFPVHFCRAISLPIKLTYVPQHAKIVPVLKPQLQVLLTPVPCSQLQGDHETTLSLRGMRAIYRYTNHNHS